MVKTRSADKAKPEAEEKVVETKEVETKKEKGPAKKISKTTTAKKGKKGKQLAQEHQTHVAEHKGKATEKKEIHESKLLEKGHIYFFYRPKVEHHEAHNAEDVQKLYMVLRPQAEIGAPLGKNRLFVLANKKLPIPKKHDRYWAFVDFASSDIDEITSKLEPVTYETKTRGERHVEGCRPCGCGVYSIVHHLEGVYRSKQHTHLAYVLEVPDKMGPVQHAFNIEAEGSFILTVKNPTSTATKGLSWKQRASYPKELQDKFEGKHFVPVEPTSLMDYEGAELILIGAKENIVEELGKVGKDLEETASEEEYELGEKDHRFKLAEEEVFHQLHMHHKEHPAQPLLKGKWE